MKRFAKFTALLLPFALALLVVSAFEYKQWACTKVQKQHP